jgi:Ca2+-binding EF-hand superfamily protein
MDNFEKIWGKIIAETDVDGDGEIDFDEFKVAMGKVLS